jgi:ferredoxin
MRMIPVIDLGRCSHCRGCIEIAPEVFRFNDQTGLMEVVDLPLYPQERVDEAISFCPEDCIAWESIGGGDGG